MVFLWPLLRQPVREVQQLWQLKVLSTSFKTVVSTEDGGVDKLSLIRHLEAFRRLGTDKATNWPRGYHLAHRQHEMQAFLWLYSQHHDGRDPVYASTLTSLPTPTASRRHAQDYERSFDWRLLARNPFEVLLWADPQRRFRTRRRRSPAPKALTT